MAQSYAELPASGWCQPCTALEHQPHVALQRSRPPREVLYPSPTPASARVDHHHPSTGHTQPSGQCACAGCVMQAAVSFLADRRSASCCAADCPTSLAWSPAAALRGLLGCAGRATSRRLLQFSKSSSLSAMV